MNGDDIQKGLQAGGYSPTLREYYLSFVHKSVPLQLRVGRESIAGGQIVKVPDVSFYQDINTTPRGIDFGMMKQTGAAGVCIRGGQNLWIDEDFAFNWRHAKEAGLPRASYWYLDPRVKPQDQADLWAAQLLNDAPELDLWADYEAPDTWGGAYKGYDGLYNFLERMKSNMPGRKLTIYTGYYYWIGHAPPTSASLNYFGQYGLNIAWYTSNPANVRIPTPWNIPVWWQYTDKGNGPLYGTESLNVDLNYFCGGSVNDSSYNGFVNYFGLGTTPPPPSPAGGTMIEVRSNNPNERRSIRNGHSITATKIQDLPIGGVARSNGEPADIYVYTANVPDASIPGGFAARAGDKWIRIFDVNGSTLPAIQEYWLAVIHLGVVYTVLTVINPPPPPTADPEIHIDLDVVNGTLTGTVNGVDGEGNSFSHTY